MKRIRLLIFVLLLAACDKETTVPFLEVPVPDQDLNLTEKGLSLALKENSFDHSPPYLETTIRNDSQQDYEFGEFYYIEVNIDKKWHIMKHTDAVFLKNPQYKDFGRVLSSGSMVQQTFHVQALGVTLIPGEYRLVKTFLSHGEPYSELSIAASFTIR